MPAGAPRTSSPPKEKVIELGKDLVEWINAPMQPGELPGDRLRFADWYCIKHFMTKSEFDALCKLPEFSVYYEYARAKFAQKINNSGKKETISEGIAQRYMRYYVPEVRDEENEKLEFEAATKAKQNAAYTEEDIKRAQEVIEWISRQQSENSDLSK